MKLMTNYDLTKYDREDLQVLLAKLESKKKKLASETTISSRVRRRLNGLLTLLTTEDLLDPLVAEQIDRVQWDRIISEIELSHIVERMAE